MKTNEMTRKSSKEKTKNMENSTVKTNEKSLNYQ